MTNLLKTPLRGSTPANPRAGARASGPGSSTTALVAVVCLAQFMVILDVTIVNVALPSIKHGLGFSTTGLQWVVNAYTITFAGFLLLGGRAADLLGRRLIFIVGTAAFALCSLACAVSDSQTTLIVARALQGLAGALLSPATLSIITTSTREGHERGRALGAWGAIGGLGASSGALLGGLLTQELGWPAIFAVNLPLGLFVIVAGLRVIPAATGRDVYAERHFDLSGAVLATAGLATLSYGIVRTDTLGWGSPGVLLPIAAAFVLIGAFLYVEHAVARAPLMPLSIFRNAHLRWANVIVLLLYAGLFASFYFLTLYLQQVLHDSALVAGVSFLPMTLSVFAGSTQAPKLIERFGIRAALTAGMVTAAAGLLYLTGISPQASYATAVLPGEILGGFGMGTALVTGTIAAMQGVPRAQSGLASGLLNTARLVGGALGLATLSTIAADQTRSDVAAGMASSLTDGFSLAFAVGAGFTIAGAVTALALLRRPRPVAALPVIDGSSESEPDAIEAMAA